VFDFLGSRSVILQRGRSESGSLICVSALIALHIHIMCMQVYYRLPLSVTHTISGTTIADQNFLDIDKRNNY
jgi:phosphate/sulfate permease